MKKPTESWMREVKANGCMGRTIKRYSYVVTMCKKGEAEVMAVRMDYFQNKLEAVRMDYFQNKLDAHKAIEEQYPGWRVKTISKLYEEDFDD